MLRSYSIVLFPQFKAAHYLEKIRQHHDSLADIIPLYVPVVHPFEFDNEQIIKDEISYLAGKMSPFEIVYQGYTHGVENNVLLKAERGRKLIEMMHCHFYNSFLKEQKEHVNYLPGIQVARTNSKKRAKTLSLKLDQNRMVFKAKIKSIFFIELFEGKNPIHILESFDFNSIKNGTSKK